jgi:uncharacterized protein (TIGR02646 family)
VRYIDLDLLLGDVEAQKLIDAAEVMRKEMLSELDDEKRRQLIKAKRKVYAEFRSVFEEAYGRKCWYTESRNPGTDDDIDHYRPKGKVADCPGHGGYWWLAFDWRNLRLSCHRANRRRRNPDENAVLGKGNHFPLLEENRRWCSPEDACHEEPELLDPIDPEDPPLLTFDIDGRVAVAPAHRESETAVRRVEASRQLLHLDWPAFVEDRRDLYAEILRRVDLGDRAEAGRLRGEASATEAHKDVIRGLIRMTGEKRDYSRAAIAYIRRFRDRKWIERAVLPNIPPIA